MKCADVKACLLAGTPTIGSLARSYGERAVRSVIEGCIVGLCEFVNIPRATMSESQARQTAALIVEEFRNLTIADVVMIFRRGKLGQWGEFYGRLDGQMILGWFGRYFDERCEQAATLSEIEAHRLKDRDQRTYTPEMILRLHGEHRTQQKRLDTPSKNDLPACDERNEAYYTDRHCEERSDVANRQKEIILKK